MSWLSVFTATAASAALNIAFLQREPWLAVLAGFVFALAIGLSKGT